MGAYQTGDIAVAQYIVIERVRYGQRRRGQKAREE